MRRILVFGAVLAVSFAATALAAPSGVYSGKTSQKLKITITVSHGKIVNVSYAVRYGSCGEFTGTDKLHASVKKNRFKVTTHPNSETVDKLSGHFKGKKVSGTLRSVLSLGGIHPRTCRSGKLKFSATFAGARAVVRG